jgi:hypothetical protein
VALLGKKIIRTTDWHKYVRQMRTAAAGGADANQVYPERIEAHHLAPNRVQK